MEIDVDVLEKDINTSVDSEVLNASATEENIVNASVEKENVIDCSVKKNIIQTESDNTNVVNNSGGTTDHSRLKNLDYESSGHKGFASKEDVHSEITIGEDRFEFNDNQELTDFIFVQVSGAIDEIYKEIERVNGKIPNTSQFITKYVADLVYYYTKSETYTKTEVNNLIGAIKNVRFEIVETLPTNAETNVIYLLKVSEQDKNYYDEYIFINNAWELIGNTKVDLSGYATEVWVNTAIKDFLTEQQVDFLITSALSGYVTTEKLTEMGFLTEEQLEEKNYITEDELAEKDYATKSDIPTNYVTTDTSQTITKSKKFNDYVYLGTSITMLGDTNGTITMGRDNNASCTPTIKMRSNATGNDYDVKITASNGGETDGQGTLEITSAKLTHNGKEISTPIFNQDFNIKNEDGVVKTFTNTGTTIDDKYIFAQKLPSSQPYSEVIFTENEYVIVYAKNTNQVFVSRNGIDFEEKPLNYTIKNMIRLVYSNRLVAFCNDGWFAYSDDDGVTWQYKQNTAFTTFTKIYNYLEYTDTFMIVNESTKRFESVNNNFNRGDYLNTTITPNFVTMLNKTQIIWCTTGGVCKYKAGSQESNMPTLPSGTVNLLKKVNGVVYGGYRNDNKIVYLDGTTTTSSWVTCTLPDTCTTNDIIYNPKDQTYYILTDINTYYKTKDFITFESFDKDNIRIAQGTMTLVGLMGVSNESANYVYVSPTQQKIEDTLQELKRAVNKERWVGTGLQLDGEVISVRGSSPIMVNANGVSLMWGSVDVGYLLPEQAEKVMTGGYYRHNVYPSTIADEIWNLWDGSDGVPVNVMFLEGGTFYDPMSWETEYTVEKGDYGYLISKDFGMSMPFTKTGSLAPFLN